MIFFKCPHCGLCMDLTLPYKRELCPMCGSPLDKFTNEERYNSIKNY